VNISLTFPAESDYIVNEHHSEAVTLGQHSEKRAAARITGTTVEMTWKDGTNLDESESQ
jgi:hypothetical protein